MNETSLDRGAWRPGRLVGRPFSVWTLALALAAPLAAQDGVDFANQGGVGANFYVVLPGEDVKLRPAEEATRTLLHADSNGSGLGGTLYCVAAAAGAAGTVKRPKRQVWTSWVVTGDETISLGEVRQRWTKADIGALDPDLAEEYPELAEIDVFTTREVLERTHTADGAPLSDFDLDNESLVFDVLGATRWNTSPGDVYGQACLSGPLALDGLAAARTGTRRQAHRELLRHLLTGLAARAGRDSAFPAAPVPPD